MGSAIMGEVEMLRERLGISMLSVEQNGYEQAVAAVRASLGEKAFASAWIGGSAMTAEQVLSTLSSVTMTAPSFAEPLTVGAAKGSPAYPAGLSKREVEVLRLVAQGLTDVQVADQLIISPRTVNYHMSSIYSKIGVSSRSAATRYAIEHHLL
jgi:DNA-binding NarL/FixJ family response regulator